MLQTDPVKKLQSFAENNKQTQGKFTVGDEKVGWKICASYRPKADQGQEYNVFMRVDVSNAFGHKDNRSVLIFDRIQRSRRRLAKQTLLMSWLHSGR